MAAIPVLGGATSIEGNPGSVVKIIRFPLDFAEGASPNNVVTGDFRIQCSLQPQFCAVGGTTCAVGTDFLLPSPTFTIPPNTPNGTFNVALTICGDTIAELDERIDVFLDNVVGAQCRENCGAHGTILNDDGPLTLSINSISVNEPSPLNVGALSTGTFSVSLSHVIDSASTIQFTTTANTAIGGTISPLGACTGDFVTRSGSVSIPAVSRFGAISVSICRDFLQEPNETFFVDVSGPGTARGTGTIINTQATFQTGNFQLSPADARVRAGDELLYTLVWTVPEGEAWRDLSAIDLRLRDGDHTALHLRWEEASNTFSLCRVGNGRRDADGDGDSEDDDSSGFRAGDVDDRRLHCGQAELPGSDVVRGTGLAKFHVAESSVVGSGPSGAEVTLILPLSFTQRAAGRSFDVELAASDDLGHRDRFVKATEVRVVGGDGH